MTWLENEPLAEDVHTETTSVRLPDLLLISEVAAYLRRSERTIRRLIGKGAIPSATLGGTTYIPAAALIAYIDTEIQRAIDGKHTRGDPARTPSGRRGR